ncbi:MAG: S-layer homology domain-containing protein [Thermoleophilia bacterium]
MYLRRRAEIVDGYPDGTFRPRHPLTRGQFANMSVSGPGVDTVTPVVSTFGVPGTSPLSTFSMYQSALRVSTNAAAARSTSVAGSGAASRKPAVCRKHRNQGE